ncbi:MAG TPA: VOC family protein [Anaeromyxobacteraceae bacterium]|nr:VOC family protein [Anaeromyxobacteraceae bacterium]
MAVKPIPDGYNTLTPFCALRGCAEAIDVYRKVFGAELRMRFDAPDGTVAHCELRFGDSNVMMGEATKEVPVHNMRLMMYVPDCDATYARALSAGFTSKEPPTNQFYGDRNARVIDRFGNEWYVSTHVEDVSEEEMRRRMAKLAGG